MFTKLYYRISDYINRKRCERLYATLSDEDHAESLQMDLDEYHEFMNSGLSYRQWMDLNYKVVRKVRTTRLNPSTGELEEYFEEKEFKYSELFQF